MPASSVWDERARVCGIPSRHPGSPAGTAQWRAGMRSRSDAGNRVVRVYRGQSLLLLAMAPWIWLRELMRASAPRDRTRTPGCWLGIPQTRTHSFQGQGCGTGNTSAPPTPGAAPYEEHAIPLVTIKPAAGTLTEKQEGMEASITAVIVAFEGCASA
jgi:hypothetical protein